MRTPLTLAVALVLVACGRSDRRDDPTKYDVAPSATRPRGPDPIVLRVARTGGPARAYAYPNLDSAIWTSSDAVPAVARVLGFDPDGGTLAYVDARGFPGRLDLRSGSAARATSAKLRELASADGTTIYGIAGDGSVQRLTREGRWTFKAPLPPRTVYPQPDGSLLLLADRRDSTVVWRVRPPEERVADSAVVPRVDRAVRTQVGDRVYFPVDSGLIGLRGRDLAAVPPIELPGPITALVPTPSGDRLYALTGAGSVLHIIDRYQGKPVDSLVLAARAGELRMDPLGRYLLVRMAERDSAWVIAVGTERVIGTVPTTWRADLPLVAPDGQVALASGTDVQMVDGETLRRRGVVRGGARDFWEVVFWEGFRPRAAGLDEPVTFPGQDTTDSARLADSLAFPRDTAAPAPAGAPPAPGDTARAPAARREGFFVSFASFPSEAKARERAATLQVEGQTAHVVTSMRQAVPIYRVVLGPYATRQEAERIGRAAQLDFWIFEGTP